MPTPRLPVDVYIDGIRAGNRVLLSRAITLIESQLLADKTLAQQVLEQLLPHTGRSVRIGITGVPGVGKSTFIEAFGGHLTTLGNKVAVLAIDPSSQRTQGSILGDKTRMETLSRNPLAYIRPSPTSGSLGGVANKTRESILLCEAAGFDVIIVETVGVGQSEVMVKGMTDFFLLLMLAGAGDELQGIKKGIMEMADAVVVTKNDGENQHQASRAKVEYQNALHLLSLSETGWHPPVLTCSATENKGIEEVRAVIEHYQQQMQQKGFWLKKRQHQNLNWLHECIRQGLEEKFYANPQVIEKLPHIQHSLYANEVLPIPAAKELLSIFTNSRMP